MSLLHAAARALALAMYAAIAIAGCTSDPTAPVTESGQFKIAFNTFQNGTMVISTMNADGTALTQLTSDSASMSSYPEWSPDGRTIAYVAGGRAGDVYTMNADGTAQTFIYDGNDDDWDERPIWMRDGKRLFVNGGIITIATRTFVPLDVYGGDLAFSKDESRVAFIGMTGPIGEHLYVTNADGSNRRQLTSENDNSSKSGPAWSPDGRTLAYVSSGGICTIKADGTDFSRLTDSLRTDAYPAWSPDGSRIMFVRDKSLVMVMNSDGTNVNNVATGALGRDMPSTSAPSPRWSPDGATILFVSMDVGGGIFSVNPDGTNRRQLLNGYGIYPAWSPVRVP